MDVPGVQEMMVIIGEQKYFFREVQIIGSPHRVYFKELGVPTDFAVTVVVV